MPSFECYVEGTKKLICDSPDGKRKNRIVFDEGGEKFH